MLGEGCFDLRFVQVWQQKGEPSTQRNNVSMRHRCHAEIKSSGGHLPYLFSGGFFLWYTSLIFKQYFMDKCIIFEHYFIGILSYVMGLKLKFYRTSYRYSSLILTKTKFFPLKQTWFIKNNLWNWDFFPHICLSYFRIISLVQYS